MLAMSKKRLCSAGIYVDIFLLGFMNNTIYHRLLSLTNSDALLGICGDIFIRIAE